MKQWVKKNWKLMSLLLLTPSLALGADKKLQASIGTFYNEGDYTRSQDTEILYFPASIKYSDSLWTAKLTLPYLRITAPSNTLGTEGIGNNGGNSLSTEEGPGDSIVAISRQLKHSIPIQSLWLDLTGKVKIPTADEDQGLGTGEYDYSAQLDMTKAFSSFILFNSLGRKFRESSQDFKLNDQDYVSLGTQYKFKPALYLGLRYDYKEAASSASAEGHELTAFSSWRIDSKWTLTLSLNKGFADGSPDIGTGLQITRLIATFN